MIFLANISVTQNRVIRLLVHLTLGVRLRMMVEMICFPDQRGTGFQMAGGWILISPGKSIKAP